MKYIVDVSVEGFFRWVGEAPNKEIAQELAIQECSEADFGPLEDIEYQVEHTETDW